MKIEGKYTGATIDPDFYCRRLQNLGDNDNREPGSGIDTPGQNLSLWLDVEF